jgi:hypothetical protein
MKVIEVPETHVGDTTDDEVTVVRGPGREGRNLTKVHGDARQYAERQLFGMLEAGAGGNPLLDAGTWLSRKKAAYGQVLDMLEERELRELDLGCIGDQWRAGLSIAWGRRSGGEHG